jgi:hypothetical protein
MSCEDGVLLTPETRCECDGFICGDKHEPSTCREFACCWTVGGERVCKFCCESSPVRGTQNRGTES